MLQNNQSTFVLLLALLLGACGGGGDNGESNNPPANTPPAGFTWQPVNIKTFRFSWADVSGATGYRLLENPDGMSGFALIADLPAGTTTYDHVVPLHLRLNARYLLQSCTNGNCTDQAEIAVSGNLAEAIGYIKAGNTGNLDEFGTAVALSGDGNTLAVGAPFEDADPAAGAADDTLTNAGAVYIYVRNGTTWQQQAYLKADNADARDEFGTAVALSRNGDVLVVGAPNEDADPALGKNDNSHINSGAVYVFGRSGATWTQTAYLKGADITPNDNLTTTGYWFGSAVALSAAGDRLAVGAPLAVAGPASLSLAGTVFVFDLGAGGAWTQTAFLLPENQDSDDKFGYAVALSADGKTLAASSLDEDGDAASAAGNYNDNATNAGAAYVFTDNGTAWVQQAYLKASNAGQFDQFGKHLALSGDGATLAVGAWTEASDSRGINGDGSNDNAVQSGAVYVFAKAGNMWQQQAYIKAANARRTSYFGRAVALSGDGARLAVGAYYENSAARGLGGDASDTSMGQAGAAYLFSRMGGAWSQTTYIKASNTAGLNNFGFTLSLSDDAGTLAVGAPFERSKATGVNGDQADNSLVQAGAVYLY